MKKITRLTESDLTRIVKKVINEQNIPASPIKKKGEILVRPELVIDCTIRRFIKRDLPDNLEGRSYYNIIDYFCEKYKDNIRKDD